MMQQTALSAFDRTTMIDIQQYIRFGWWIVLFGFGGFTLWASLAPLDKGVPLSGFVASASKRKAVQHENSGTVEAILVKEGDHVKQGDVLVRMNHVQAKARAESNRAQYFIAMATEARLIAERDGLTSIHFPAQLTNHQTDQQVMGFLKVQQQVFVSRQAALRSDLSAIDESMAGIREQTAGLAQSQENKKQQLKLMQQQIENMRDLARDGYVANNRLLDLEQNHAQINAAAAEDFGNIGRGQHQMLELKLQKQKRIQEYQKDVRTQLQEVQKQVDALSKQGTSLDYELANVLVKAPVSGTVVGLNVFTQGAVVGSGFKMMEIVPSDDALVVEGQLPVHLVDKIKQGLEVELIFSAFNRNSTPHIPGEVIQISADRLTDETTQQPYYKVVAKVTQEGSRMLNNLKVKPGMPVEMFVKTGERTMMNYLLKPIFDHLKLSMSEE